MRCVSRLRSGWAGLRFVSSSAAAPIVLRPYQESAVSAVLRALGEGRLRRIGVSAPTGSGRDTQRQDRAWHRFAWPAEPPGHLHGPPPPLPSAHAHRYAHTRRRRRGRARRSGPVDDPPSAPRQAGRNRSGRSTGQRLRGHHHCDCPEPTQSPRSLSSVVLQGALMPLSTPLTLSL